MKFVWFCAALLLAVALTSLMPASTHSAAVDLPHIQGRVIYHSYRSYSDGTGAMFLLSLSNGTLTKISRNWTNLQDPMNASWSHDGTRIVFMAKPIRNGRAEEYFDVFLYTIGDPGQAVNLTNTPTLHDEDPKFSPDGTKIVYKVRPSILREMDLTGRIVNTIISEGGWERSMPDYAADGKSIWFAQQPAGGGRTPASIRRIGLNGAEERVVVEIPGVLGYYPIRDSAGYFLYSRWASATNTHDQVFAYDGIRSTSLPFNSTDSDYSDAYPINARYMALSSTRSGGKGGYDLYVADRNSGVMWTMSLYNPGVNTNREELGLTYTPIE